MTSLFEYSPPLRFLSNNHRANHHLIINPAKPANQPVDDYLLHRGRLSELSFSFLQPKQEGNNKRTRKHNISHPC